MGGSSSSTQQFQETNYNTETLYGGAIQDNKGNALSGIKNSNVSIVSTDNGAISAAFDFSANASDSAFDFGNSAFDFSENASDSAFDFGNSALKSNNDIVNNSMQFAQRASENALQFAFDAGRPDSALNNKIVYVGGGLLTVAALALILKKGKK